MSARVEIAAAGVLAPGLAGWPSACAVLTGVAAFAPDEAVVPVATQLAPAERRRLNINARWALAVASEVLAAVPASARSALNCVFASADGDGDVLGQTLAALAAPPVVMSPTLFHNSVFNSPAGYCSIAHGLKGASTSLCACEFTFGAALVEACDQVTIDDVPVLLVVVDTAHPDALAQVRKRVPSFACALLLRPVRVPTRPALGSIAIVSRAPRAPLPSGGAANVSAWAHYWSGDTAAAALPLLAAVAQRAPASIDVVQPAEGALAVDYRP